MKRDSLGISNSVRPAFLGQPGLVVPKRTAESITKIILLPALFRKSGTTPQQSSPRKRGEAQLLYATFGLESWRLGVDFDERYVWD